jgi:hypothetical protein
MMCYMLDRCDLGSRSRHVEWKLVELGSGGSLEHQRHVLHGHVLVSTTDLDGHLEIL